MSTMQQPPTFMTQFQSLFQTLKEEELSLNEIEEEKEDEDDNDDTNFEPVVDRTYDGSSVRRGSRGFLSQSLPVPAQNSNGGGGGGGNMMSQRPSFTSQMSSSSLMENLRLPLGGWKASDAIANTLGKEAITPLPQQERGQHDEQQQQEEEQQQPKKKLLPLSKAEPPPPPPPPPPPVTQQQKKQSPYVDRSGMNDSMANFDYDDNGELYVEFPSPMDKKTAAAAAAGKKKLRAAVMAMRAVKGFSRNMKDDQDDNIDDDDDDDDASTASRRSLHRRRGSSLSDSALNMEPDEIDPRRPWRSSKKKKKNDEKKKKKKMVVESDDESNYGRTSIRVVSDDEDEDGDDDDDDDVSKWQKKILRSSSEGALNKMEDIANSSSSTTKTTSMSSISTSSSELMNNNGDADSICSVPKPQSTRRRLKLRRSVSEWKVNNNKASTSSSQSNCDESVGGESKGSVNGESRRSRMTRGFSKASLGAEKALTRAERIQQRSVSDGDRRAGRGGPPARSGGGGGGPGRGRGLFRTNSKGALGSVENIMGDGIEWAKDVREDKDDDDDNEATDEDGSITLQTRRKTKRNLRSLLQRNATKKTIRDYDAGNFDDLDL